MIDSRPRAASRDRLLTVGFAALGLLVGAGWLQLAESEETQEVDAEAVRLLYEEGVRLQRAKQTDAAIVVYERALAMDPKHAPTLYEVGWSYWVLGRWSDVVRVWEKVLTLEPAHPEVPRYLPEARTKAELLAKLDSAEAPATTAPRPGAGTVRLTFGGDTMMGSALSNAGLPPDGGSALFDAYADRMKAADLAFLNLEGVLLDSGRSHKCPENSEKGCYAFRMPVAFASNLVNAGVDVVSFANNHANDYGPEGRASTTSTLDAAGIAVTGPLDRTVVLDANGTRVGYLGFATSPLGGDLRDLPLAQAMVRELDASADVVVVSFHGGAEGKQAQHVSDGTETFMGEDRGDVKAFARAVIEAGADLVVGHGPHVLRGMEIVDGRLVAYSLGNFVTYGGFNLSGANGLTVLLEVDLQPDGTLAGARVVPGRQIPPGGPRIDPDREAIAVLRALSTADFPDTAPTIADDGTITP